MLKHFITNVLKCRAHLNTIYMCMSYYVFLSDKSLVTLLYGDQLRYLKCLNIVNNCLQAFTKRLVFRW